MKFLTDLLTGNLGSTVEKVAEVFTTTDRERIDMYRAQTDRIRTEQATDLEQIRTNREQAKHASLFVAGARPAVLWLCAAGLAYHFLIYPLAGPVLSAYTEVDILRLEWEELRTLLFGLLGLGTLRSYEKVKGVSRESL